MKENEILEEKNEEKGEIIMSKADII